MENEPFHPIKVAEAKRAILDLIDERGDHITFAEINHHIPNSIGDLWYSLPELPNTILWTMVSRSYAQAISELTKNGEIHVHPANITSYLADGIVLELPLAKTTRKYKEPHWFPVTFSKKPLEA